MFVILISISLGIQGASKVSIAGQASKPYPAETKIVDGVKTILNPEYPRDGVLALKGAVEWSVGGENDPQGDLLNRPQDLRVGPGGSVYILDWGDVCIRSFGPDGKFIRIISRKGQGPGEIQTPAYFDVAPNGDLYVMTGMNRQVARFSKDGTFVTSWPLDKFATQLRADGRGFLYRGEQSTVEPEALSSEFREIIQQVTIVRTNEAGQAPFRFGPFLGLKTRMKGDRQGVVMTSSRESPSTGWGVDRNGRIYAGHNEKYEIGVHDPDGKLMFRFGRAFKPFRNPNFKAGSSQPENLPAFVPDFFFDDSGNIWFRLFKADDADPHRYDVFSPEGVYLRQIVTPSRIYRVWKGKAYAIDEDEDGFRVLKCLRLELEAAGKAR
jgi:hypothetical protein